MERTFKITESRLQKLLTAEAELDYLSILGVDHWGWYGTYYSEVVADYMGLSLEEVKENCYDFSDYAKQVISKLRDNEVIE